MDPFWHVLYTILMYQKLCRSATGIPLRFLGCTECICAKAIVADTSNIGVENEEAKAVASIANVV